MTTNRVMVVGDLHAPATHPGYLSFIQDTYAQWDCNQLVFIGDVVDLHAISFHSLELDAENVFQESELAAEHLSRWYTAFPKARVCIGNHDERVIRKASSVGIPEMMMRPYKELWDTPKWDWNYEFYIDGVRYTHGTGTSGERPAYTNARASMTSTVMGHTHTVGGVSFLAGPNGTIFGMNVGCGVDPQHPAMRYSRRWTKRPVLGCGVVIDGDPFFELMDAGGIYRRENFK